MPDAIKRLGPWLAVWLVALGLSVVTTRQALDRYHALASGWSWDLAYYNQWFWALTRGDGVISVRPISSYGDEGPSVWKMNYLAPVRFAITPLYWLWPDPKTLLVVQNLVFWWVIPAAFGLARGETRSTALALAITALVPATPLLWPLVWNDFRELQLAMPFVLWAIDGYRGRRPGLATLGIVGMLACRQEFGIVVASLALVPPRESEPLDRSLHWAHVVFLVGLSWFLFAFLGYLRFGVASNAPQLYLAQFGGPRAPIGQTVFTVADFLLIGLGSWALLACLAPRVALLALPWVWTLASGKWALRYIATEQWHHVRYTAPFVALGLAAGIVGLARLANALRRRRVGPVRLALIWVLAAFGMGWANGKLERRFARVETPIARGEAESIWSWIEQVGPDDSVLAAYEISAPLSSRRRLFSYVLPVNRPRGFPGALPAEFRWVFLKNDDLPQQVLIDQGFVRVFRGKFLSIFRRGENNSPSGPKKR